MKIVEDVPGSRLLLKERAVSMPARGGLLLLGIASMFVIVPGFLAWYFENIIPAVFAVAAGAGSVSIWRTIRRYLASVELNGTAGEIRFSWRLLLGGEIESEVFHFADLDKVRVASAPGNSDARSAVIHFVMRGPATPGNPFVTVDSIKTHKDVADFALRVGSVLRLPGNRVVRNDPREFEIELTRGPESAEPVVAPPVTGPEPTTSGPYRTAPEVPDAAASGPSDDGQGVVTPLARAAAARVPRVDFTPPQSVGAYNVAEWSPGTRIRFHQSIEKLPLVLVVPMACLALLGPVASLAMQREIIYVIPENRFFFLLVTSVIGLVPGAIVLSDRWSDGERQIDIDWARGTITLADGLSPKAISMADVVGLDLVCRVGDDGSISGLHHSCALELRLRRASPPEATRVLIETSSDSDSNVPYRATYPLATEIAKSLGVPHRVRESDGKILDAV